MHILTPLLYDISIYWRKIIKNKETTYLLSKFCIKICIKEYKIQIPKNTNKIAKPHPRTIVKSALEIFSIKIVIILSIQLLKR